VVRGWIQGLEGDNRRAASELMNQVIERKLTNEEVFALIDKKHNQVWYEWRCC
jgi:hypothetical protein